MDINEIFKSLDEIDRAALDEFVESFEQNIVWTTQLPFEGLVLPEKKACICIAGRSRFCDAH